VLPVEWTSRAVTIGAFSPAEFFNTFLAPTIADGSHAQYANVFEWWKVAATLIAAPRVAIGGDVSGVYYSAPALGLANKNMLATRMVLVARRLLDGVAPHTGDPLTNATFQHNMNALATQMDAHNTAMTARETARTADQTFAQRFSQAVYAEMLNILNVADEAAMPPVLRELAKHKKQGEDIPFLRASIDERADMPDCVANEFTKPKCSGHIVRLLREYRLVDMNNELSGGLSPFCIVCCGHPEANATNAAMDSQLLLEQNSNSISLSDARTFTVKDARLPKNEFECCEKLMGHSLLVDLVFGNGHALAVGYRACLTTLQGFLTSGLRVHYPESPGKRLHIALRMMYWITTEFADYIDGRRQNRDPPLPNWNLIIKMTRTKNFDGLGELPEAWLQQVKDEAAPTPAPAPGPSPAPAGGAAGVRVSNDNQNPGLKRRFEGSGCKTVNEMLKKAKDAGKAVDVPTMGGYPACLTFHLLGRCWGNCKRAQTHKYCPPAVAAKIHSVMDACDVPPLPAESH